MRGHPGPRKRAFDRHAKRRPNTGGPRSPDLVGRTGVWFFATNGIVAGNPLADHRAFLARRLLARFQPHCG